MTECEKICFTKARFNKYKKGKQNQRLQNYQDSYSI